MEKTNFQKRCEDCVCLVVKDGKWCCEECFGQPIEEVDDCPEGITLEEVKAITEKTKGYKHVETADKPKKERKPRERKLDEVKVNLIQLIGEFLATQNLDFVEVTKPEREIDFKIGADEYTLTLTKHRKPKAQK